MVKQVNFKTNGSATSGTATEDLSGQQFIFSPPSGMMILDLFQTSSGTAANDADWQLVIDGIDTRYKWTAEELNPANVSRVKLPTPIKIRPNVMVQFKWSGQSSAASNILKVLYE